MIGVPRGGAFACLLLMIGTAQAAESPYPFEGSWTRADRSCAASPARERIYTARDVISSRGRCVIRKIAGAGASFELFERCERPNERSGRVSEIIRMTGPDSMVLTRQTARLKLSRSLHFVRCPAPSAAPVKPPPKPSR